LGFLNPDLVLKVLDFGRIGVSLMNLSDPIKKQPANLGFMKKNAHSLIPRNSRLDEIFYPQDITVVFVDLTVITLSAS